MNHLISKYHSFRYEFYLILTIALSIAYFTEWGTFQTSGYSEQFFETKAIVEDGSYELTKYSKYLGYDQAVYNDKIFSGHAPGQSYLQIPAYVLLGIPVEKVYRNFENNEHRIYMASGWFTHVGTFIALISLSIVLLFRYLRQSMSCRVAFACSILMYFGTLWAPYSTVGFEEPLTAALVLMLLIYFSRYIDSGKRCFALLSSLLVGIATAVKDLNILFILPLLFCLLIELHEAIIKKKPTDIFSLLGLGFVMAAVPLIFLFSNLIKNLFIFDGIFNFPNLFLDPNGPSRDPEPTARILFDPLVNLNVTTMVKMFFGGGTGILFYSPFLIYAVSQLGKFWGKDKRMFILISAGFLVYFLYMLSYPAWFAGANAGWRLITPALMFPAFAAVLFIGRNLSKIVPKATLILVVLHSLTINSIVLLSSPWVEPKGAYLINPPIYWNLPTLLKHGGSNVFTKQSQFLTKKSISPRKYNVASTTIGVGLVALSIALGWRGSSKRAKESN